MRYKIRNHLKVVGLILLFVVVYNEYLIYYIQTFKWPTLRCTKPEECVKILLVADPQILGDPSEGQLLLKFFNWDCDRYLSKTYAQAVRHAKPDIVLFLGDLTNDGSIAGREEFYGYVKRISEIFNTQHPIKHVWIPGDNDIGGENGPIKPEKVKMFNAAFRQPDYVGVKSVDVFKANLLMQYLPGLANIPPSNRTRIAISHMPLLLNPGRFTVNTSMRCLQHHISHASIRDRSHNLTVQVLAPYKSIENARVLASLILIDSLTNLLFHIYRKALTKIQPSAIFSGHNHEALRLSLLLDSNFMSQIHNMHPKDPRPVVTINLKQEEYTEFVVPTSSYRMNVVNIGYGVAYVDDVTKKLQYTVLWSPQRFYPLKLYVITVSSVLTYILLLMLYKALAVTRAFRLNYSSMHGRL